MKKLSKIINAIERYLTKSKSNDWIEDDDVRYTKIVDKYSKKLVEHWQETRDSYAEKIKQKSLDIDESTPQYEDIETQNTDYVKGALEILALAFGEAVIVGYEELIGRGTDVDIPKNPWEFFDNAGEIKNYSLGALSYEQQQIDELYHNYNNTEDAKQKVIDWFNSNQYRVENLMIGGLVWYGINFGFANAAIESQGEDSDLLLYWLTEKDKNVCKDCLDLEAGSPYSIDNPLKTLPGGGKTICGSSCRCIIDTKTRD